MIIRKATQKDLDKIIELWQEFMDEHDKMAMRKDKRLKAHVMKKGNAKQNVKKFFAANIASKQGNIFIATDGGRLVGYCLAYVKANIPIFSVERLGYISDMYIKKGYRRKGIATKLKNSTFRWFKSIGLKHASISHYMVNTRARKTYESWGFVPMFAELRKQL